MNTFYKIFYGLFIGLLIVVGGLFLIPTAQFKTDVEAKIVKSGSMTPAIPVGALVFVKPSAAYSVGDVITFGEDSASAVPTTHRIVSVRIDGARELYTTKGDANEEADPRETAKSEVIGKVFFSLPYAGFLLNFARQPIGFALLIALPALLVILSELAAIIQEVALLRLARRPRVTARRTKIRPHSQSIEYARRFAMDDIFIPTHIFDTPIRHLAKRNRMSPLPVSLAVICIAFFLALENSGATVSYFRDAETSTGNTFSAGTWQDFVPAGITAPEGFSLEHDAVDDESDETRTARDGRDERVVREERNIEEDVETIASDNTEEIVSQAPEVLLKDDEVEPATESAQTVDQSTINE